MAVNGKALAAASIGGLLVWSGVKGWSVLGTLDDLLSGSMPSQSDIYPLTSAVDASGGAEVGARLGGIAATAMQYEGHAYKFGGAPGVDGSKPWDCSSMVNWVCGVAHGLPIPGYSPGKYRGTVHGPATGQWAVWNGLEKVPREMVSAGDIIVWVGLGYGHMGIAIDNDRYVSALNPKTTTRVRTIDGFGHKPVRIGRFT